MSEQERRPEEPETSLEQGKDISELFKPVGTQTLEFEARGRLWRWRYRALSWPEHFDLVERAWETVEEDDDSTGEVFLGRRFNAHRYYETALMLALEEGPGGRKPTLVELRQLGSDVIRSLIAAVPNPNLAAQVEKAKKD